MLKKILITGGAGFIGSHTVAELANSGYEPVIVDNFSNAHRNVLKNLKKILAREIAFHEGDCCDRLFMEQVFIKEKKIHGVIHFAAFKAVEDSKKDPLLYYRNNLDSLIVLLEVMKEYGTDLLVFSSSSTVYGAAERLPVTEETPLRPAECPYGSTKQMGEQIIKDAVASGYGLKAVLLRYFNPIGAHETALIGELPLGVPKNLVPYVMQAAAGILPHLTVNGNDYDTPDGTPVRDYIHVVDLSAAHVAALKYLNENGRAKEEYDIFNLGTGRGNSVMEVISTFEKTTGVKIKYRIGPRRPGDVVSIYADVSKAEKILDWKAKRSLSDALKSAWDWQKTLKRQTAHDAKMEDGRGKTGKPKTRN